MPPCAACDTNDDVHWTADFLQSASKGKSSRVRRGLWAHRPPLLLRERASLGLGARWSGAVACCAVWWFTRLRDAAALLAVQCRSTHTHTHTRTRAHALALS